MKIIMQKQYFIIPDLRLARIGLVNFGKVFFDGTWRLVQVKDAASYFFEGIKIMGFFIVGEMIGRGSIVAYQIPG